MRYEMSKLTRVHRDYNLYNVQNKTSSKIFGVFYENYVFSLRAMWEIDPRILYEEYKKSSNSQGIYRCTLDYESVFLRLH
jgi:hypothetical protein